LTVAIHGTQPKGAKRSAAPKQETSPEGLMKALTEGASPHPLLIPIMGAIIMYVFYSLCLDKQLPNLAC